MMEKRILVALACSFLSLSARAIPPQSEYDALRAFYDASRAVDREWVGAVTWFRDEPNACLWHGITCNDDETHVIALNLSNKNIQGLISPELGNLTELQVLDLSQNLIGYRDNAAPVEPGRDIPGEIGNLSKLELLDLHGNMLEGPIPPGLANLPPNVSLNIANNELFLEEPIDEDLQAFLDDRQPDWADTQTIPPTNISVVETAPDELTVSWTPVSNAAGPGYYSVYVSPTSGGPYYYAAASTQSKEESSVVVSPTWVRWWGANFVAVITSTVPWMGKPNIASHSVWSREATRQCQAPLETVRTTGDGGLYLGDADGDSSDEEYGTMISCYDPVNDCYLSRGIGGTESAATYTVGIDSEGVTTQSVDSCGGQSGNSKSFHARAYGSQAANQQEPIMALAGATSSLSLAALNCVDFNQGEAVGCLKDLSMDGAYDAVEIDYRDDGLPPVVVDVPDLYYPDAQNPTHIRIPGLRMKFSGSNQKVRLFVPVNDKGEIVFSRGDQILGKFDFDTGIVGVPGVTVPICGNGTVELWEECDDGNTTNNDGCSASCEKEPSPADIDLDGSTDALTDGLLLLRYMSDIRGAQLIDGVLGPGCTRCAAADIEAYIDGLDTDIDDNSETKAEKDGLLLLRYLFGFRGDALIEGAVASDCTRCTATAIEGYCRTLVY